MKTATIQQLFLLAALHITSQQVYAQQSKQDSINLQRLLNTNGEIELNRNIIDRINFGKGISSPNPLMPARKKTLLRFDETLPSVYPKKPKTVPLILKSYTMPAIPDRKTPPGSISPDLFKSKIFSNDDPAPPKNSEGGAGMGGLDFTKPFTKEFWSKKGVKRREQTLKVLQTYGDSTTVLKRK